MEGRLRDESVWERQAQEAGDARGQAEEEEVPVKARGFSEGEFGALGNQGRDVVVEPEEDREQEGKRDGEEDVGHADFPEVDEPAPFRRWEKGRACREI